jgi:tetratricopeptide (TPR) repeat protein
MLRVWTFCLALLLATPSALANEKLDTLFAQLRDPASGAKILSYEQQIWDIWMHEGDNAQNERLAKATMAMNVAAFDDALEMLTALVQDAPNFAEAWNKRATLYFMMGRLDNSLSDITKTLDLEPRHFGALSGRGMIYAKQGRNAEALIAYKEALAIHPKMVGPRLTVQQLEKLLPEL